MALIWTVFPCEDLCPISIQNADSLFYCCLWHAEELLKTSNSSDCWGQVQKEMFKSFELKKSLDCDQNCCLCFFRTWEALLSFRLSTQNSSSELHVYNSSTNGLDDKGSSMLWGQLFISEMATPNTNPTMISLCAFSAFWNLLGQRMRWLDGITN